MTLQHAIWTVGPAPAPLMPVLLPREQAPGHPATTFSGRSRPARLNDTTSRCRRGIVPFLGRTGSARQQYEQYNQDNQAETAAPITILVWYVARISSKK